MKAGEGIAALILSAGLSSRMGELKPLLRIGSVTILETAVANFRRAGVDDVTVVVGHRAREIVPLIERLGARWVLNAGYRRGMLSSVLTGIRGLGPHIRAFFLLPGDMPLVRSTTIDDLIGAYRLCPSPVVYPVFQGDRGHPALISVACVSNLTPHHEGGLRSFLHRYRDQATDVQVTDQGVLMDCDTPADYRTLLSIARLS